MAPRMGAMIQDVTERAIAINEISRRDGFELTVANDHRAVGIMQK